MPLLTAPHALTARERLLLPRFRAPPPQKSYLRSGIDSDCSISLLHHTCHTTPPAAPSDPAKVILHQRGRGGNGVMLLSTVIRHNCNGPAQAASALAVTAGGRRKIFTSLHADGDILAAPQIASARAAAAPPTHREYPPLPAPFLLTPAPLTLPLAPVTFFWKKSFRHGWNVRKR
jgi:hypothetical protein